MRKVYVSSLVKTTTTRRLKNDNSNRLLTFEYYLKKNNENLRICKKIFLNNLTLKKWMVKNWLNQATNNKIKDSNDIAMPSKLRLPGEPKRGLEIFRRTSKVRITLLHAIKKKTVLGTMVLNEDLRIQVI